MEQSKLPIDWLAIEFAIKIRDQSNAFVNTIALLQLLWMLVQTLARWHESLSVSPLEIATCAHIICAVFTYGFWWSKPRNVQEHFELGDGKETGIVLDDWAYRDDDDQRVQPTWIDRRLIKITTVGNFWLHDDKNWSFNLSNCCTFHLYAFLAIS